MKRDWRLATASACIPLSAAGFWAQVRITVREFEFAMNGCPPNVFCTVYRPLWESLLAFAAYPAAILSFLLVFWTLLRAKN